MKELVEKIKNFFNRWYLRFKLLCYIYAIWAVLYSSISICGLAVAFEYDDGIVYSEIAKKMAMKERPENYDSEINRYTQYERTKVIPFFLLLIFKVLGFNIDIIADRPSVNTQDLNKKWRGFVSNIYFVEDQNKKYEILESKKYLIFFSNSDEGIIQAKKSGVYPVRIKRNPKSTLNNLSYNPGKFKEKVIILSEF